MLHKPLQSSNIKTPNALRRTSTFALARALSHVEASTSSSQILPASFQQVKQVRLKTRADCELEVSVYPTFAYNAVGGGGWADAEDLGNGLLKLSFNPNDLYVPDLSFRTASIFKIPLPPPLTIAIQPKKLEGTLDQRTGEVNLEFSAEFKFTAGPLYSAPPLIVNTLLTTSSTAGRFKVASGEKMKDGRARLVGAAQDECNNVYIHPNRACIFSVWKITRGIHMT
ncbi:hypothetical protein CEUSTIGMA_g6586.t1 [Chlamydomonas eustigma]|uniref:Uncharacterized protein n=1 Tax=Chlamydomonas eustigma TaxID=1157962 RepID=A0A250X7W0_9CHLO|nr:hypothetical protein CEUSTIGMA_g6586.t1 [Chlamydomonas eustigma]|eukprot:GAX79146.1 hypothetical protein CEUSTIGMA_g6586.t1 [Chlamydomonas eustigma]